MVETKADRLEMENFQKIAGNTFEQDNRMQQMASERFEYEKRI